MTTSTIRGRQPGSRNIKPSKKAVRTYYRLLQEKAEQGDTQAAGWLCLLDQQKDTAHE